jgi:hypothetical protein
MTSIPDEELQKSCNRPVFNQLIASKLLCPEKAIESDGGQACPDAEMGTQDRARRQSHVGTSG